MTDLPYPSTPAEGRAGISAASVTCDRRRDSRSMSAEGAQK
jgi:hypothetical protein